jgi:hypothetical protein
MLLAMALAAPLATGCVARSQGHGPPAHAWGWRGGGPSPGRVPPGQVRRAEVHERNAARKEQHGHGHGHDRD